MNKKSSPLASGWLRATVFCITLALPQALWAESEPVGWISLTATPLGYFALSLFVLAYLFVMVEEFTHLRKSKPVILAAGVIWGMIAWQYGRLGLGDLPDEAFRQALMEFAELFLFLLAAMTYVNAMEERLVFEALRSWLVRNRWSYRQLFWITGFLAFFLSPMIDNLTTALVMCAVVLAVGKEQNRFIGMACVNIVVAANAGGAFSPFGDITTLMVWQKGEIQFQTFFLLFIPSVVNFVVPALCMHFFIPGGVPEAEDERVTMRRGALAVVALFVVTVLLAVSFHRTLNLPPMLGMMTGLGLLQVLGYYLKKSETSQMRRARQNGVLGDVFPPGRVPFDIYGHLARAEWDTLLFFYGVVLCVAGLGFIGYLAMISESIYGPFGFTLANSMIGVLSAVVDNIPVMFAVLTMNPDMPLGQWLLVTLTTGVGGSLLSIGSAAGVALMGQARGKYTFFSHLKWTPVIALGYVLSILVHLWVNAETFSRAAGG